MKKIAIVVTTTPSNPFTQTACQIIHNALSNGIKVVGVFFYQAGVLNASKFLSIPSDEFPIAKQWKVIAEEQRVPLYLCSTAAEKHGLIDENSPLSTDLIREEFTLSGLGELVELTMQADRLVQL